MRKYRKNMLFLSKQNLKRNVMENSICIGEILKDFNWWAYIGSVVTVFIIGAIWFSFLFMKMWVEANKIDLNQIFALKFHK